MFSDPLSASYDGTSVSLIRLSTLSVPLKGGYGSKYAAPDDGLSLKIAHSQKLNGDRRVEVTLTKTAISDSPITGEPGDVSNSVGIVFELDQFDQNSDDVDLLRTALLALVNSTFQDRIASGES